MLATFSMKYAHAQQIGRNLALWRRGIACLAALPETHQMLQKTVREFAKSEIEPKARLHEREKLYPATQIRQMGAMGLMAVAIEEQYGGAGLDYLAYAIAVEEIARGDAACAGIMAVNNLYVGAISQHGDERQKAEFLAPYTSGERIGFYALSEPGNGSDAGAVSTLATRVADDYKLSGAKAWISNLREADGGIIFATTDRKLKHKGITAFVTPKGIAGLTVGKNERKMGMRAASTCPLMLDEVRIPAANVLRELGAGFKIAMQSLDCGRIGVAAQALGIAQAALDLAVDYAQKREAFGRSIAKLQLVQQKLAEMALRVESARLLTWRAAWLKDHAQPFSKQASMAKLASSETATYCAHQCMQVLGGMGYVTDMPAELYYRNARVTEIYEGTSEIQRLVIANSVLRELRA